MVPLNPFWALTIVFAAALLWMFVLWLYAERKGKADIVDAGWAAGIGVAALFYALVIDGHPYKRFLSLGFVALWSCRLVWLVLKHRALTAVEDGRYQDLREHYAQTGANVSKKFLLVFLFQGALVAIFSVPILLSMLDPWDFFSLADVFAGMLFVVSFGGESIADLQLKAFKKDPANKGKVCNVGLWRYSRHPNYFFEWLFWWVFVLLAYGQQMWSLTLVGPALMLYLILFVTGVRPSEIRSVRSRGEAYKEYQRTTSAFIPWFPKR